MMLESQLLEEHTLTAKPDTSVSAHKHLDSLNVSNRSFTEIYVFDYHRAQSGSASSEYTAGSEFLPSGSKAYPVRTPSRAAKCVDPLRLNIS
jgi:hypothetical protein